MFISIIYYITLIDLDQFYYQGLPEPCFGVAFSAI
tara:strand:+ start:1043 stop:1147 length:105 start_codon:yes stop_codon:yes gene_type:complete